MQTNVVVFEKEGDLPPPPGRRPAKTTVDRLWRFGRRSPLLRHAREKSARREKLTQPFWTWFIENPRSRGVM
jgi:hypothetical protein